MGVVLTMQAALNKIFLTLPMQCLECFLCGLIFVDFIISLKSYPVQSARSGGGEVDYEFFTPVSDDLALALDKFAFPASPD